MKTLTPSRPQSNWTMSMRSTFTALLCKLKRLISLSRKPSRPRRAINTSIYSRHITHTCGCMCVSVCECVCRSQWLLNLICQQINGPSLSWPPLCARVNLFLYPKHFQISSSHLQLLLFLRLLLFFSAWTSRLDPSVNFEQFQSRKTISFWHFCLFLLANGRPINQFYSSRLSKQKSEEFHNESIEFVSFFIRFISVAF